MSELTTKILIILDGWGYSKDTKYNAIAKANTPQWDYWIKNNEHILLDASGVNVGLPDKQMGNSEVGHMHIGAGRIIFQDFTRINASIKNNSFFENQAFLTAIKKAKAINKSIHIAGLFSKGGVHSHEDHFYALLKLCEQENFKDVYLHLFLDGRDTPPKSANSGIKKLIDYLQTNQGPKIASISGRYFAMDRDNRWDRIKPVYDLLTNGESANNFNNAQDALNYYYAKNITDEFIPATKIDNFPALEKDDSFIFVNFRADRARQLTNALISKSFNEFKRNKVVQFSHFITMTKYADFLPTEVAFPIDKLKNTLGEIASKNNLTQLRIAETEKYAHVTFFLNGGIEKPFKGEDRLLIQSPKVSTYDLKPEMSAFEITEKIVEAIDSKKYNLIIANFANADMVGHTGNMQATMLAIEALDKCLSKINVALEKVNGDMLITSDHGNAECMFNDNNQQTHTAHTNQPVPLLYVGNKWKFKEKSGSLIDIAPTLLKLLNLDIPQEMTGKILLF